MGGQFWWFYDVIAVAVVLVCVFLGGRKGFTKSAISAAGCVLAAIIAFAVGSSASESLSRGTIRDSNAKKIASNLDTDIFIMKYTNYLETMGYTIKVKQSRVEEIFESGEEYDEKLVTYLNNINGRKIEDHNVLLEKVHEGFAAVTGDIISVSLNKYAAETAVREMIADDEYMQELVPHLMNTENMLPAAKIISEKYTAKAYETIFSLGAFVILFVVFSFIIFCCTGAFSKKRGYTHIEIASHISGGVTGIVTGSVILLAVAAAIRLWAVMGSNEMLFFNNDVIDKSYIFKYIYGFAEKF